MTSRDDDADDHARCQATIDRLALELAQVSRELVEAEARARTWRRVAAWIHGALMHPED